jgi:hypothetical protein
VAYQTQLADVLRAAGQKVYEVPGWQTRGHGSMSDIRGVLAHHTGTAGAGNYPSLAVVRDGRSDLPGPLANLGLARDGTWYVIAAGLAYHAGTGSMPWCGTNNGNEHLIGIEAESNGGGKDWTSAQLDAYPRGVAALLKNYGLTSARAIGHKEWAPGRKPDPTGIDMNTFRSQVQAAMSGNAINTGGFLMALSDQQQTDLYNRIFGMLHQRYFATDKDGKVVEVAANAAGAKPAAVLDSLDGNYLVSWVQYLADQVAAVKAAQTAPAPVEVDYDRIVNGVVAKLGALSFDVG